MRRTQIYLTDQQDRLLSERARDQGLSKAEVIRRLLDERLGTGSNQERAEAIRRTAGLLADYPDWPEWLGSVRGVPADERMRSLGL
jgi:Ribbon-helix-helix protein, copG family